MRQHMLHPLRHTAEPIFHLPSSIFHQQGFPQPLPDVSFATTMDGRLTLTADIYINKVALLDLQFLFFHGQRADLPCAQGLARLLQWTDHAFRRLGCALDSSEVHDGLVVEACRCLRQQTLCQCRKLLLPFCAVNGRLYTEIPRQHAIYIAINHRSRQPEGDAPDGSSGIVTNTLQLFDFLQRVREMS